jgi:hypothetical protein
MASEKERKREMPEVLKSEVLVSSACTEFSNEK